MAGIPSSFLTFRIIVVVCLLLTIAAIHAFRLGSLLSGKYYILYYSYASDLLLPFGAYFLLCLNEIQLPPLRSWIVKAAIIMLGMTVSELFQYFGIYFFGTTYDPVDLLMYAIGTLFAVAVDKLAWKTIPLWSYPRE